MPNRKMSVSDLPHNRKLWLGVISILTAIAGAIYTIRSLSLLDQAEQGFYYMIGAAASIGLLTTFYQAISQHLEVSRARRFLEHLESKELSTALDSYVGHTSYFEQILFTLRKQFLANPSRVDFKPSLNASYSGLTQGASLVSRLGMSAQTIGVLGTLLGMSLMVVALADATTSQSIQFGDGADPFAKLFAEDGPLRGMLTAFNTSLAGGVASLTLRSLAEYTRSNARKICDAHADIISRDIWPLLGEK